MEKKHYILAFLLWISLTGFSAFAGDGDASHDSGFSLERDGLCFINDAKSFTGKAIWPLHDFAVKHGACQGLDGIARAFFLNAKFTCEGEKPDAGESQLALRHVLRLQRADCREKIEISGYCSLREFCAAHRPTLERQSIYENAFLTLRDTAKYHFLLKAGPYKGSPERDVLALKSFQRHLAEGRTAFLLYPRHVVQVISMTTQAKADVIDIVLRIYDPNENRRTLTRTYRVDKDFTHTIDNKLPIFDVTPKYDERRCGE